MRFKWPYKRVLGKDSFDTMLNALSMIRRLLSQISSEITLLEAALAVLEKRARTLQVEGEFAQVRHAPRVVSRLREEAPEIIAHPARIDPDEAAEMVRMLVYYPENARWNLSAKPLVECNTGSALLTFAIDSREPRLVRAFDPQTRRVGEGRLWDTSPLLLLEKGERDTLYNTIRQAVP